MLPYKRVLQNCTNIKKCYKPVAQFYEGQSAFITGATGFIGKALVEKLLYSCTGIDKVYLLIRENKENNAHQRLQQMLEQPVFTRLREENPKAFEKIVPIMGDISKPKLGLKPDDEHLLTDAISIVFHIAATVKFTEPLDVAMNLNVYGTERVLNLCQRMKNIKALVHVSTAFSNMEKDVIEEVVYPAPSTLSEVRKIIENGTNKDQVVELLKTKPNTYIFTKALAENVIADNHGNVPTVIIRPSGVTSSIAEPMVGWIDGWFATTTLTAMMAQGWSHCLLAKPKNIVDLIPVDYVANLMIVAAARSESSTDVAVKNCATSMENPITYEKFLNLIIKDSLIHKTYDMYPFVLFTRFKFVKSLITMILQTMPAYAADVALLIRGKKKRYTKIQHRISVAGGSLECATTRSMCVPATKAIALAETLSPLDKETFPFNPTDINWDIYIPSFCKGVRKYLIKK